MGSMSPLVNLVHNRTILKKKYCFLFLIYSRTIFENSECETVFCCFSTEIQLGLSACWS